MISLTGHVVLFYFQLTYGIEIDVNYINRKNTCNYYSLDNTYIYE